MGIFKKLFYAGCWDIVFAYSLNELKNNNVKIIRSSLFEWYADPFLKKYGEDYYVFCERKKLSKRNGDICLFKNFKKNSKKTIIKEQFHLSFPNIFQFKEQFYIIPESSRGNSLRLYGFDFTTEKAVFIKTIMDDCKYVDSIIDCSNDVLTLYSYDLDNKICVFSLDREWKPTFVKTFNDYDYSLRPAGNPKNGCFYFQNCKNVYGESIICKELNNDSFCIIESEHIDQIDTFCKTNSYLRFHTLNFDGECFVFDVYKERFNLFKPFLHFLRLLNGNK